MTKKQAPKKLHVTNIGPVRDFSCEVSPGMNLLEAANGAGKTCILSALARATGVDLPVEVTDGATSGKLELDGTVLLSLTRSKAKLDPSVEVSLASVSPLAIVIDPGLKDKKAAEVRRIQALLQLVDLKTTEKVIAALVDEDEGAVDVIGEAENIEDLITLDPVAASGKIKRALEAHKRSMLANAEQAHGRWQASKPETKPERMSKLTIDQADAAYREAAGNERETKGSAEQRAARETERERIRLIIGDRPDLAASAKQVELRTSDVEGFGEEVNKLRRLLAVADKELEGARQRKTDATIQHEKTVVEDRRWVENKAILDSEIMGATETDVQRVAGEVTQARLELDLARATAEYRKALEASESARIDRDRYTELAERYEKLAKDVPARLAGLLDQAGIPNLTVEDGILTVIHESGDLEPFYRLSAGQRTRFAMPIFIKRNPNRLVAFPETFWNALEDESKAEVAGILEEFGVVGLTEIASHRGDPLKVEHFEA